MQNFIFQVSTRPIAKEDFIKDMFSDGGYEHLVDYCSECSDEEVDDAMQCFDIDTDGVLKRNGNEFHFDGYAQRFRFAWRKYIIDRFDEMDYEAYFDVKKAIDRTHLNVSFLVYLEDEEQLMTFGEFMNYLLSDTDSTNSTYYLGGVLWFARQE